MTQRSDGDRATPTVTVVSTVIGGREVSPDEVQHWERRRLPRAARQVGLTAPTGSLDHARVALAEAKIELGEDEIRRRLARSLTISGVAGHTVSTVSLGRRTVSRCELAVHGGDARTFADWFRTADRAEPTVEMLAANPDHFLILRTPDGRLDVVESVGGSPLPSELLIDHDDTASLRTRADPQATAEIAGVARTPGGRMLGGVRHLFYDTDDGFRARLQVEFPRMFAPHFVHEHRWHLAVEFGNWIRFAFDGVR